MGPSTSVDGEVWDARGEVLVIGASMGPSTSVDGEPGDPATGPSDPASLQWGRRQASTERPGLPMRIVVGSSVLQWGRRQASTESGDRGLIVWYLGRASMGPSTSVDGEVSGVRGTARYHERFNGAVDKRRRRETQRVAVPGVRAASMGPSTSVDGEMSSPDAMSTVFTASMGPSTSVDGERAQAGMCEDGGDGLQWGRRQASTESDA